MANKNDSLFKINAGVLLAKLHLASKDMYKGNIEFYNAGIDGKPEGSAENPGDTVFNMKNIGGIYEIAASLVKDENAQFYYRHLQSDEIALIKNKHKDLYNQTGGTGTDKDHESKYDAEYKKLVEALKPYLTDKELEGNPPDDKNKSKLYHDYDIMQKEYANQGYVALKKFMENFCGKQNADKIKANEVVKFIMSSEFDYAYPDFKVPVVQDNTLKSNFQAAENEKKEKLKDEIGKKKKHDEIINFIKDGKFAEEYLKIKLKPFKFQYAYKIGYSVELETM